MFTGIIAGTGKIKRVEPLAGDIQLAIEADVLADKSINLGDSVAVNGVCLTVVAQTDNILQFDVSRESLSHTLIAQWGAGTMVNLEPALTLDNRLGGHLVSGHIDGVVTLLELLKDARSWRLQFEMPANLAKYIARKGSVTLDGISLTVNSVGNNCFDVNIVPHTWQQTNLANKNPGDQVHLEVDLIARYLERLLGGYERNDSGGVSAELLSSNGFIN
ncbi:MAG: riboflavin synthase [Proteobacteria bacterium]|nr:riboflavin synthase [Pseudomonadota bacterium]